MRITSLNLQGLMDWEPRRPRIEAYVRATDPDVLLLQEVVYLPQVTPWTNADLLNRALGYPHAHSSVTRLQAAKDGSPYREGLAVLSRWPVRRTESLALLHHEGDPHHRIVQLLDVTPPEGEPWLLGNVHDSVRDDYALAHLREILGILAARRERRVLAGDFNVNHLERHAAIWRPAGYVVSTRIAQYDSHPGTVETDDYVLAPEQVTMTHVRVSPDGLSDHRALTVDLSR